MSMLATGRLSAVLLALAAPLAASEPAMPAGQLAHELDRLNRVGRVLYVAAHPDDENTRLLTHLANERHLKAAYLSMTRGGGGQNLVGEEQGEMLDVIRTEELLAARRLDGALQFFTRMRDFGYSKSADETLAAWGKEEALADMVWVIRSFQPDVILTRFDEKPPNHGHHTASAILAREAFAAAADPKRFPEQLARGVTPWQAERLMHNISPWRNAPVPEGAIELDVGGYDARLGLSYGELAAQSRSRHVSQGFGVAGERGPLIERFVLIAGSPAGADILDGVDVAWTRFGAAAAPLASALEEARAALERDNPERALPALLKAHRAFDALPDEPRVRDGRRDLDRLIASAAGLFVRATAPRPTAVPGEELTVDVEIVLRRPAELALKRVVFPSSAAQDLASPLELHAKRVVSQALTIPSGASVSAPYWLEQPALPGRQVLRDPKLVGLPLSPPALEVGVELGFGDRVVKLAAPVVHSWVDPVHGERIRDVLVVPPATITPSRDAFLFRNGAPGEVSLRVRAARDGVDGELQLPLPAGWSASPRSHAVKLAKRGDETMARFTVTPAKGAGAGATVTPVLRVAGRDWSWRETIIDHDHVPLQLVLQPSSLKLVPVALEVPAGRVGYIEGSGDTVAEDLAHVGFQVEPIDDEALRAGDLSRFAAIVVGIRAFNTREEVRSSQPRLMEYVERGGRLLVQYNTNNRLAPLTSPIGPHPFEIGRDRITDEHAVMTPVRADHPVLLSPHAIGPSDFEDWVQERGIYFASKWDEKYEPLFSSVDPGEEPLLGGTLVTAHGKGRFVYTGLAFFRQLPAGVPGAYRLFVNLIAPEAAPAKDAAR